MDRSIHYSRKSNTNGKGVIKATTNLIFNFIFKVNIPKDIHGRTRIVFRRFDSDELPEMAAIITDPRVTSFRDIDRELFNAAREPNEDLAVKEIEKYLKLHANVNAVFEKNRRFVIQPQFKSA